VVLGVETNIDYLRRLLADPEVAAGRLHTGLIGERGDLATRPAPEGETLAALLALAVAHGGEVPAPVPALHAAMGAWRN
jgi:acetyl/propionyl-CoA carboxylase alpha subunit